MELESIKENKKFRCVLVQDIVAETIDEAHVNFVSWLNDNQDEFEIEIIEVE